MSVGSTKCVCSCAHTFIIKLCSDIVEQDQPKGPSSVLLQGVTDILQLDLMGE